MGRGHVEVGPLPERMVWRAPDRDAPGAERAWAEANLRSRQASEETLQTWCSGWRGGAGDPSAEPGRFDISPLLAELDLVGAVDAVLATTDLDGGRMEFAVGRLLHELPGRDAFVSAGGRRLRTPNLGYLIDSLSSGKTAILNGLAGMSYEVSRVCEVLDSVFCTQTGANAYLSFEGAVGFGPHWDEHDLLVVQLHGTKRWTLEDPLVDNPLRRWISGETSGSDAWDGLLSPGDALWVPRGYGHRTASGPGLSVHLSFYVQCPLLLDLLPAVFARAADDAGLFSGGPSELVEAVTVEATTDFVRSALASWIARIPSRPRGSLLALGQLMDGKPDGLIVATSMPGGYLLPAMSSASKGDLIAAGNRMLSVDDVASQLLTVLGPVGQAPASSVGDIDPGWVATESLIRAGLAYVDRMGMSP